MKMSFAMNEPEKCGCGQFSTFYLAVTRLQGFFLIQLAGLLSGANEM